MKRKWLAYPYGDFSAELEQLVAELGFIGIGRTIRRHWPWGVIDPLPRYPSSSQFAALQHFMPKLKTLALPVTEFLSKARTRSAASIPPTSD